MLLCILNKVCIKFPNSIHLEGFSLKSRVAFLKGICLNLAHHRSVTCAHLLVKGIERERGSPAEVPSPQRLIPTG